MVLIQEYKKINLKIHLAEECIGYRVRYPQENIFSRIMQLAPNIILQKKYPII